MGMSVRFTDLIWSDLVLVSLVFQEAQRLGTARWFHSSFSFFLMLPWASSSEKLGVGMIFDVSEVA